MDTSAVNKFKVSAYNSDFISDIAPGESSSSSSSGWKVAAGVFCMLAGISLLIIGLTCGFLGILSAATASFICVPGVSVVALGCLILSLLRGQTESTWQEHEPQSDGRWMQEDGVVLQADRGALQGMQKNEIEEQKKFIEDLKTEALKLEKELKNIRDQNKSSQTSERVSSHKYEMECRIGYLERAIEHNYRYFEWFMGRTAGWRKFQDGVRQGDRKELYSLNRELQSRLSSCEREMAMLRRRLGDLELKK